MPFGQDVRLKLRHVVNIYIYESKSSLFNSIELKKFMRLSHIELHSGQIFARMDDWIKDRVREENEAIKEWCLDERRGFWEETERQLRSGRWEDEE